MRRSRDAAPVARARDARGAARDLARWVASAYAALVRVPRGTTTLSPRDARSDVSPRPSPPTQRASLAAALFPPPSSPRPRPRRELRVFLDLDETLVRAYDARRVPPELAARADGRALVAHELRVGERATSPWTPPRSSPRSSPPSPPPLVSPPHREEEDEEGERDDKENRRPTNHSASNFRLFLETTRVIRARRAERVRRLRASLARRVSRRGERLRGDRRLHSRVRPLRLPDHRRHRPTREDRRAPVQGKLRGVRDAKRPTRRELRELRELRRRRRRRREEKQPPQRWKKTSSSFLVAARRPKRLRERTFRGYSHRRRSS